MDVGIGRLEPFVDGLGEEDGAVLSARAAKGDHQVAEMPFFVVFNALAHNAFHVVEEDMDGRLGHEVVDDFPVAAGLGLELGFATRIGQGTTVEDEAAAVAAEVGWVTFLESEAIDSYGQLARRWSDECGIFGVQLVELANDALQLRIDS